MLGVSCRSLADLALKWRCFKSQERYLDTVLTHPTVTLETRRSRVEIGF
jgi:hypothetical protein